MLHEVRAVVAVEQSAPVGVRTIVVPDPCPGEVLVRVVTSGTFDTLLHDGPGQLPQPGPPHRTRPVPEP
ncbi:hypothetical protein ABTZ58_29015 [Streptomyces sp. NPDC094143]|uniref:hypothetical protein n=1 Tax=Streptomyces sp. NPDC094143 TaxID=3155310 RepID=UPI00332D8306